MAKTSYISTSNAASGLLQDFSLGFESLSLKSNEEIVFRGYTGDDRVYVGRGVSFNFTASFGGNDTLYTAGKLSDFTITVNRSEISLLDKTTNAVIKLNGSDTGDKIVFADGFIFAAALKAAIDSGTSPVISGAEKSVDIYPTAPVYNGNTTRAFGYSADNGQGAVFRGANVVRGTAYVDKVYANYGESVNALGLLGGNDQIYLTGKASEYSVSVGRSASGGAAGFTVLEREVYVDAAGRPATAGTGTLVKEVIQLANDDTAVFADGSVAVQTLFNNATLTPAHVAVTPAGIMTPGVDYDAATIAALADSQMAYMSVESIEKLSTAAIAAMSTGKIAQLTADQIAHLNASQLGAVLSTDERKNAVSAGAKEGLLKFQDGLMLDNDGDQMGFVAQNGYTNDSTLTLSGVIHGTFDANGNTVSRALTDSDTLGVYRALQSNPNVWVRIGTADKHIEYAGGVDANGVEIQGNPLFYRWSFTTPEQAAGAYIYTVRLEDANGVASLTGEELWVNIFAATAPVVSVFDDVINVVDATTAQISGTTAALATVTLSFGSATRTVTANASGQWSYTWTAADAAAIGEGVHNVSFFSTLHGEKSPTVTRSVLVDTSAPGVPEFTIISGDTGVSATDGITNNNVLGLSITGGEAGAKVTIFDDINNNGVMDAGEKLVDWTVGAAAPNVTLDTSRTAHNLRAFQTDAAGNAGLAGAGSAVTLDQTIEVPVLNAVAGDNAISSSEADQPVVLSGTAEAFASISVQFGALSKTVTANAAGVWTTTLSAAELASLTSGSYTTRITATDPAGNVSSVVTREIALDHVLPAPTLAIASGDTGSSSTDGITNSATLGLTLSGKAGATVTVFDDLNGNGVMDAGEKLIDWVVGTAAPTVVLNNAFASHRLIAFQTEIGGQASDKTSVVNVVLDQNTQAPTIDPVTGDSQISSSERAAPITFTGTAEANAQLSFTIGAVTKAVTADNTGKWSTILSVAELNGLTFGLNTAQITATDIAGNENRSVPSQIVVAGRNYGPASNPISGATIIISTPDNGLSTTDNIRYGAQGFAWTAPMVSGLHYERIFVFNDKNDDGKYVAGEDDVWYHGNRLSSDYAANEYSGSGWLAWGNGIDYNFNLRVGMFNISTQKWEVTAQSAVTTVLGRLPTRPTVDAVTGDDRVAQYERLDPVTFTGTADAGTRVDFWIVKNGAVNTSLTPQGSVQADGYGRWSVSLTPAALNQIDANANSGDVFGIYARSLNIAGLSTEIGVVHQFVLDLPPPKAPMFSDGSRVSAPGETVTTKSPSWVGWTGANSYGKMAIFIDANDNAQLDPGETFKVITANINSTNAISFIPSGFTIAANGTYKFRVQQLDEQNLPIGYASEASTLVYDTIKPEAQPVDLDAASDSGRSNSDNITNATSLTFNGVKESNSSVVVFHDANNNGTLDSGETTVFSSGRTAATTYTFQVSNASAVNYRVIETDLAGNVSNVSAALQVTIDRSAPSALARPVLLAAEDTGSSSADAITKSSTLTFNGTREANAQVTLVDTVGGVVQKTIILEPGAATSYTMQLTGLSDGVHTITAYQTDAAGNQSSTSAALTVTIDTVAPTVPPGTPDLIAADDTGSSNTDNVTSRGTLNFTGSKIANEMMTLFDDANLNGVLDAGEKFVNIAASSTTSYTATLSGLSLGEHHIRAFHYDVAGNIAMAPTWLDVTVVTVAP